MSAPSGLWFAHRLNDWSKIAKERVKRATDSSQDSSTNLSDSKTSTSSDDGQKDSQKSANSSFEVQSPFFLFVWVMWWVDQVRRWWLWCEMNVCINLANSVNDVLKIFFKTWMKFTEQSHFESFFRSFAWSELLGLSKKIVLNKSFHKFWKLWSPLRAPSRH